MAEAEKGKGNDKELEMEEGGGGGKKKMIMIIAVAVVMLLLGGVGAYFMFGSSSPESAPEQATLDDDNAAAASDGGGSDSSEPVNPGSALYVAMPRPFVFNVPGSVRDRLVQIKVQLLVRGDAAEEEAKRHIPLIEGSLLRTFSSTNADDLATTAGKEALKSKSLQDVQATMVDVTGKKIVERVLFTGFVMQ